MDFQRYFKPEGRMRRTHYFWSCVILNVIATIFERLGGDLLGLVAITVIWPALMVAIQRAHDMGKDWKLPAALMVCAFITGILSAMDNALGLITLIGTFVFGFWLLLGKPSEGPNEYGPDPRDQGVQLSK